MSFESTLNIVHPRTDSLRATVPVSIAAFLGIKKGDKLVWKMEFVNDERVVFVTKK